MIERTITRVIELRKIECYKQVYAQLPMVKQYSFDSYRYGELSKVISHQPSALYLEIAIEKRMQFK